MEKSGKDLNITESWLLQKPILTGITIACLHVYIDIVAYSVLTQMDVEEPLIHFCIFFIMTIYYFVVILWIIHLPTLEIS